MKFSRPCTDASLRTDRGYACLRSTHRTADVLLLVLLTGYICVNPCVAQDLPQNNEKHETKIHGSVVNAVTHEPIARALVSSTDSRFAMLTDSEGHFEFTLPKAKAAPESGMVFSGLRGRVWYDPSGRIGLNARKPGFLDDPNGRNQSEFATGDEITISLLPEAVIKGKVILSSNDPASGINVQIYSQQVQDGLMRWVPGTSARTNSAGEFRFAELQPGTYKVFTHEVMDNDPVTKIPGGQLYGYPPVYYPAAADFASAQTIQLASGQTFEADLSLTRQPYFPVKIPVANGESSGGMSTINVLVQGHHGPGYSLGYNDEEHRIEGLLPSGNYVVEAITSGMPVPGVAGGPGLVALTSGPGSGAVILRVAGGPAEGPSVTLTQNSTVTLNVKEEFTDMKPNPSMSWSDGKRTYSLRGPRTYLQLRAETADDLEPQRGGALRPPGGPNDDSLVLEDLPPGRYWLRLTSSRGYVAAATAGGVNLMHEPLVVGSGSNIPVEVRMRDDNAEIEGTVTDPAMPPGSNHWSTPPWIYCVPLPDSTGQFQQLGVSDDGKFNYQMMTPGSYRVLAFRNQQPNLPYRDAEAMRAYDTKGQVIQLTAGQKASLQLQVISSE